MDAAHDFAQWCIFEIGQTGAALGVRQEEVPQSLVARENLQFFDHARRLPPITRIHLIVKAMLIGIHVLVHERLQPPLEILDFLRIREFHVVLL